MKKIVETHAQFDPGELRAFMDARGIELTAEQISDRSSSLYPKWIVEQILAGTYVLSEHKARELARVLGVPFEELFGKVFD